MNSGGANDLIQRTQPTYNNNVNNTNVVALDSSPLSKNNQQPVPAANVHTSPVAPVQQYTGPKIKIYLKFATLGNKKAIVTYPTEDNNGVPVSAENNNYLFRTCAALLICFTDHGGST